MALDPNMKILVVDDLSTVRRMMRGVLRFLGFENIVEAENGAEALEIVQNGGVDFVLSDWNMPVMSGLDLLKNIRKSDASKDIPVLMMTGEVLEEKVIEAIRAGANDYVVKPFTANDLKEKMSTTFKSSARGVSYTDGGVSCQPGGDRLSGRHPGPWAP